METCSLFGFPDRKVNTQGEREVKISTYLPSTPQWLRIDCFACSESLQVLGHLTAALTHPHSNGRYSLCTYFVTDGLLSAFHILTYFIPILEMRILRHIKVKLLPQSYTVSCRACNQTPLPGFKALAFPYNIECTVCC